MHPNWVSKYVGLPFKDRGYDFEGCNCWGLVHLVLLNEAKIETPTYGEVGACDLAATSLMTSVAANDPWVSTASPRQFDVLMSRSNPLHVGVMLNNTHVLHIWKKIDSMIMPVTHPLLRHKIIGYFRHRDLA